tara:strand:- start:3589 stop:3936 length:348 start_codon:yes stop_codon:yes gene_type:complete
MKFSGRKSYKYTIVLLLLLILALLTFSNYNLVEGNSPDEIKRELTKKLDKEKKKNEIFTGIKEQMNSQPIIETLDNMVQPSTPNYSGLGTDDTANRMVRESQKVHYQLKSANKNN